MKKNLKKGANLSYLHFKKSADFNKQIKKREKQIQIREVKLKLDLSFV